MSDALSCFNRVPAARTDSLVSPSACGVASVPLSVAQFTSLSGLRYTSAMVSSAGVDQRTCRLAAFRCCRASWGLLRYLEWKKST